MLENDDKKVFPRTWFEPASFRLARFSAVKNIRGELLQTTADSPCSATRKNRWKPWLGHNFLLKVNGGLMNEDCDL